MELLGWLQQRTEAIESIGVIGSLLFTGLSFSRDVSARRAETLIQITQQHRELWVLFDVTPELHGIFDDSRDMEKQRLTEKERRFIGFVVNHLRSTFYASSAGVLIQPEQLTRDIRGLFSFPAVRIAWRTIRPYQDRRFARFIERALIQSESLALRE